MSASVRSWARISIGFYFYFIFVQLFKNKCSKTIFHILSKNMYKMFAFKKWIENILRELRKTILRQSIITNNTVTPSCLLPGKCPFQFNWRLRNGLIQATNCHVFWRRLSELCTITTT